MDNNQQVPYGGPQQTPYPPAGGDIPPPPYPGTMPYPPTSGPIPPSAQQPYPQNVGYPGATPGPTVYIPPSATPMRGRSRPVVVTQPGHNNQGASVIVMDANVTPVPVVVPALGRHSVSMQCPHCRQNIVTNTRRSPGPGAICCSAMLCLFCLWLFAWIPLVIDSGKVTTHYCPRCLSEVGKCIG